MKKTKKIIIIISSIIAVLLIGLFVFYKFFYNENRLDYNEKEWINNHKTTVISFNVPANLNVFSTNGAGVFFDFLNGFNKKHDININKNIISTNDLNNLGFVFSTTMGPNDLLIHKDHYVVVSKNNDVVNSINNLTGKTLGALKSQYDNISSSRNINAQINLYDNEEALFTALNNETVKYILLPLNQNLGTIIANNYNIVYHLDDLPLYYYLHLGSDEVLNSIIVKYYNEWKEKELPKSYYENNYKWFINILNLSELDINSTTNKIYNYGFVSNSPNEIYSNSKYGGIIISYLNEFSSFSNVEFNLKKYSNYEDLIKDYNEGKVDLFLNGNSLEVEGNVVNTNISNRFYVINPLNEGIKVSHLSQIINREITVLDNTNLSKYLSGFSNLKVNAVNSERKLLRAARHNEMIAINADAYDFYANSEIEGYYVSYEGFVNKNYSFVYKNNDTFLKLFKVYINYLSQNDMTRLGLISFADAKSSGTFITLIAKYFLAIVGLGVLVAGIIISSKKHIKLNTRIKKDQKLKFVDMLTSLKNRNYLNEKISVWNQNTIYPQAIIVIDLNNIKYLNDTFGHEEGDKQIQAAANILHQTQLDNSEIMRTDGNEFMIYLVGYQEKQVVNYLKKLVKEFNNLPYEYGAAFGFSMIVDDLKLIDDAINEATIQMRENKEIEVSMNEKEN